MKGKKGYIIGMSLIILVFGLWVIKEFKARHMQGRLYLDQDPISNQTTQRKNSKKKKPKVEVDYVLLNDEKAKAPSFSFINQDQDTISEKDYNGKVYLVEFFYTSCPNICPIMNQNLVEVSKEFKNHKDFGIASFTIDPRHDTPEVLKEYAENHGITHPNWNFLTGKASAIYRLAEQDFKLIAQEDENEPGGIMHDGMFVLIDKEGYIRSRKDDFGNPLIYYRGYVERNAIPDIGEEEPQINELIEDIQTLLEE